MAPVRTRDDRRGMRIKVAEIVKFQLGTSKLTIPASVLVSVKGSHAFKSFRRKKLDDDLSTELFYISVT